MPLISNTDFMLLQGYLGSGYEDLVGLQLTVLSGLDVVTDSEDVDVTHDMLLPYYNNYNTTAPGLTAYLLRTSFDALQMHIQTQTNQTFNDYLYTRGLKVGVPFADLSALFGLIVNPTNIQS